MKKILVLVPTDIVAGAELTLKRIASHLSLAGNEVVIVFMAKGNNGHWTDVSAEKIYLNANREFNSLPRLISVFCKFAIQKKEFDYAFSSHVHCNAFISIFRRLNILRVHHQVMRESTNVFSWFSGKRLALFKFLYSCYAQDATIICQTSRMRSELLTNVTKLKRNNVVTIDNAIDYSAVRFNAVKEKKGMACHKDILMVGRLVKEKGAEVLINAFSKLKAPSYRLLLIGAGPLTNELKALTRQLGIEERVVFMGFVKNPIPYMKSAQLCVVSSVTEGFPNTLLEMMCVARRVVSTECTSGIEDIPGLVTCKAGSEIALLQAMEEALALDPAQVVARIKSMRHHSKTLTVPRYLEKVFNAVNCI